MGKSSGGGYDTSGLEAATEKSLALQKEIYDQTRGDVQPWYNMGTGSVSKLSDLLGISGGSMQSRDQIYNELLPQYTTQQTTGSGQGSYVDQQGRVVTPETYMDVYKGSDGSVDPMRAGSGYNFFNMLNAGAVTPEDYANYGLTQLSPAQSTTDSIDYEALNTAVSDRLGSQETPSDYGSLLERFDLSKFEEDPSYQYRQDQSNKALERMMAAQGVTLGGGGYGEINPQVASALQEQNQNLASQEYGNAYNRYNQDNSNIYNMLMGTAGMGQNATNTMAGAGTNYANASTDLNTSLASAQQQAAIAKASEPSMFGSILGAVAPIAGTIFGGSAGGSAASSLFSGSSPTSASQWSSLLARN